MDWLVINLSVAGLIFLSALTHGQYAIFGDDSADGSSAWIGISPLSLLQDGSYEVGVAQVRVERGFWIVLNDAVQHKLFKERLRGPVWCEVLVLLLLPLLARLFLSLLTLFADFPLLSFVALSGLK